MSVQITGADTKGEIKVTVAGDFGFDAARELLLVCKSRWQDGAKSIAVDMSGVTSISSSGVGTLILLSELVSDGRFDIRLDRCSSEVRELFSSGMLDKYFRKGSISCRECGITAPTD